MDYKTLGYIKEILNEVSQKAAELYKDDDIDEAWTKAVKKTLQCVGKCNGFTVWGTGLDDPEWLIDVSWVPDGENWRTNFHGFTMACEIEWGRTDEHIREDFLKLTVVNAALRVFIFTLRKGAKALDEFEKLQKMSAYTDDQIYLAIAVPIHVSKKLPKYLKGDNLPYCVWKTPFIQNTMQP